MALLSCDTGYVSFRWTHVSPSGNQVSFRLTHVSSSGNQISFRWIHVSFSGNQVSLRWTRVSSSEKSWMNSNQMGAMTACRRMSSARLNFVTTRKFKFNEKRVPKTSNGSNGKSRFLRMKKMCSMQKMGTIYRCRTIKSHPQNPRTPIKFYKGKKFEDLRRMHYISIIYLQPPENLKLMQSEEENAIWGRPKSTSNLRSIWGEPQIHFLHAIRIIRIDPLFRKKTFKFWSTFFRKS